MDKPEASTNEGDSDDVKEQVISHSQFINSPLQCYNSQINYNINTTDKIDTRKLEEQIKSRENEDLLRNLQKNLRIEAKKIAGRRNLPPVELKTEISWSLQLQDLNLHHGKQTDISGLDRKYHYNCRAEFQMLLNQKKSNLKLADLFNKAADIAKEKSQKQGTKEAKEEYVNRHGNIVALVGQAGIGKTTLTRMIVQLILDRELFPECEYIFYVQFRDIDFQTELTLLELVLTGSNLAVQYKSITNEVLIELIGKGEKVVIIQDGLDEANTEAFLRKSGFHFKENATADAYFKGFLLATLFPLAKKVITSRPRQFFELHHELRPIFVIDVLGFGPEAQENMCRQLCRDETVLAKVLAHLKSNPSLSASCYVPAKFIIIVLVLLRNVVEEGEVQIVSLTDTFIQALCPYESSEHMRNKERQLAKLAGLAWYGFSRTKIIFTEADFRKAKIDQDVFSAFLVTFVNGIVVNIFDRHKLSNFSHLIWQELFAAVNMIMFMSIDEFRAEMDHLEDSRYEVVTKFLFGVCNLKVYNMCAELMENDDFEVCEDREVKLEILKQFAKTVLVDINKESEIDETVRYNKLLCLCGWLHELHDDQIGSELGSLLTAEIVPKNNILPSEVHSLAYVLNQRKEPISMVIVTKDYKRRSRVGEYSAVKFVQDCFQMFLDALDQPCFEVLRICHSFKNQEFQSLLSILENVEVLDLNSCNLTSDDIVLLKQHKSSLKRMKKIILTENLIDELALKELQGLLDTVPAIDVSTYNLTEDRMEYDETITLTADKEFPTTLVSFDPELTAIGKENFMVHDFLPDNAVSVLSFCIPQVNHIELQNCQLSNHALIVLAKVIARLTTKLRYLLLMGYLLDEAAPYFADAIHNIDRLKADFKELTSLGLKTLADAVETRREPMQQLTMQYMSFGGLKDVVGPFFHNVNDLDLSNSPDLYQNIEWVAQLVGQRSNPMPSLRLTMCKLKNTGRHLAKLVQFCDSLDVGDNVVTESDVMHIVGGLRSRKYPMKSLGLTFSAFGLNGTKALASCLDLIGRLDVRQSLDDQSKAVLSEALQAMPEEKRPEVLGITQNIKKMLESDGFLHSCLLRHRPILFPPPNLKKAAKKDPT